MTTQIPADVGSPEDLRQLAIEQLRKKRDLQAHVLAYVTVNLFLTGIWLATNPHVFFWPIFPILGWGIGIAFHIWDVYSPQRLTEDKIQQEIERMRQR
ncbi:MAG TPA: 2TM domain-containing protein [Micromonosporaceae bacterium]